MAEFDEKFQRQRPILSSGEELVSSDELQQALTAVVETTLSRLNEQGVGATPLHEEWSAIQLLDFDEQDFCDAVARLGRDPFSTSLAFDQQLARVADELSSDVLGDFLDAAEPDQIDEQLTWISEALVHLDTPDGVRPRRSVEDFRHLATAGPFDDAPWAAGRKLAIDFRAALNVPIEAKFSIDDFVAQHAWSGSPRNFQALGATSFSVSCLANSRETSYESRRFRSARALWHGLSDSVGSRFLLTKAHTTSQRAGRAFAAELLAPSRGIAAMLQGQNDFIDSEDIDVIAHHYGVQTLLIEHQIGNNVILPG